MDDENITARGWFGWAKHPLQRLLVCFLLLAMVSPLALAMPVLASVVSGAEYVGTIVITNNNTTDTKANEIVNLTLSTEMLIDQGYINENCNNTAVTTGGGSDVAYMPAVGNGTAWWIMVPSIPAAESLNYKLYTGGGNMNSKIRYFPGTGGMSINDSALLELGDTFKIELKGYIDTTNGTGKNLLYKPNAFRIYIQDAGIIRAAILSTGDAENLTVNATSISSGDLTLEVVADGINMTIYIDDVEKDSAELGGESVPDKPGGWSAFVNDTVLYMEYFKIWISE